MTDDELNDMPRTSDLMPDDEFREWLASRPAAGAAIHAETSEYRVWYAPTFAPYGMRPGIEDDLVTGTERTLFYRSPETRGWVWEGHCAGRDAVGTGALSASGERLVEPRSAVPVIWEHRRPL